MRVLSVARQQAIGISSHAWREGRLCDDFPGLVAAMADRMPADCAPRSRPATPTTRAPASSTPTRPTSSASTAPRRRRPPASCACTGRRRCCWGADRRCHGACRRRITATKTTSCPRRTSCARWWSSSSTTTCWSPKASPPNVTSATSSICSIHCPRPRPRARRPAWRRGSSGCARRVTSRSACGRRHPAQAGVAETVETEPAPAVDQDRLTAARAAARERLTAALDLLALAEVRERLGGEGAGRMEEEIGRMRPAMDALALEAQALQTIAIAHDQLSEMFEQWAQGGQNEHQRGANHRGAVDAARSDRQAGAATGRVQLSLRARGPAGCRSERSPRRTCPPSMGWARRYTSAPASC